MSTLAELQRSFQHYVLAGDRAIERSVDAACGADAQTRLGVYSDAYRIRLSEALATSYPRLREWLGADTFAAVARAYIATHPSTYRSIRWFGAALPACLELSHASEPWLADLAEWEWALAAAFDAADAESMTMERLAAVAPEDWPGLRLEFAPSLQVLALDTNAPLLFRALAEGSTPPEPERLPRAQAWAIWRQDLTPRYRSLDEPEQLALELARGGAPFAAVCESLAGTLAVDEIPLRAASMLKQWIVDGFVTSLTAGGRLEAVGSSAR